jgi:hypothetical protein
MKKNNYTAYVVLLLCFITAVGYAQKLPDLDASHADIAYLRQDGRRSEPVAKIVYSRPSKKGRTMFGDKEPYGKVWRTGANETTEITLFKAVTFGDKKLNPGTYALYTIPGKDKWTVIFNSKLNTWGAFEYDESKDVVRIEVPAGKTESEVEAVAITFEGANGTGTLLMAWENVLVKVPVKW